jgi:heat shock protein HslJ
MDDGERVQPATGPAIATGALTAIALLIAGCATTTTGPPPTSGLEGTRWRLEQIQSSDDAAGPLKPADPSLYQVEFRPDGALAMKLDCNRAAGLWSARPSAPDRGTLTLSAAAMTRAMCPPGSLDTRIARDTEHVRSYVIDGDRLSVSLEADGGVYTWRRDHP